MIHRLRNGMASPEWPLLPRNVNRKFRRTGQVTARQQRIQRKAQKRALRAG